MSNRMPLSSSNSGNGGYYNNNTTSSGTGRGISNFQNNGYRNKESLNSTVNFVIIKVILKETCYKLHGYPKKKGGVSSYANNASTGNESGMIDSTSGSNARTNKSSNDTTLGQGVSMFTQEQYYEILQMLRKGKSKEVDTMANVATAGVSGTSGASNHMVHNFGLMSQSTNLDVQGGMRVNLPTGDQVSISHIGESLILKDKVPSNDQVSSEQCAKEAAYKRIRPISFNSTADSLSSLWHKRLGHAPLKVLSRIKELNIVSVHEYHYHLFPVLDLHDSSYIESASDNISIQSSNPTTSIQPQTSSNTTTPLVPLRRSSRQSKPPIWKYALGLVSELGLAGCKPSSTPLEFNHKLTSTVFDEFIGENANVEDLLLDDFGKYQRLIGKLLYLTMTRPYIAIVVQVLSQYMHSPKSSHMEAALRVVRYIKGTVGLGLFMPSNKDNEMVAYCDSDWGACVETRRSVTGYMIKLGGALVSWKSKKQSTVSRSSAEAEFRSMTTTVAEIVWLKGLFRELGMEIKLPKSN
uniref:GAG-pre-integrase domain-containing protein n=1 Tax=Solanum lycopersicum TaxID=4081 RepID=A0A3Q7EIX0_SOLLC